MEQFKFSILKVKVTCNYTWKSLNSKLCSFYGGTFHDIKFHILVMMMEFISRRNILILNNICMYIGASQKKKKKYIGINSNDF